MLTKDSRGVYQIDLTVEGQLHLVFSNMPVLSSIFVDICRL